MADNYLEKKMEEYRSCASRPARRAPGMDSLLVKNRSIREYDGNYSVHELQLKAIVSVVNKIASSRNHQVLRYRLVTEDQAHLVLPHISAGANPPKAFIVVCTTDTQASHLEFDEGIAAQSMLLKAVELGLNGLIIKSFSPDGLKSSLGLSYEPTTVLAIGKSIEKVELRTVASDSSLKSCTEGGVRFVPKLSLDDLIV